MSDSKTTPIKRRGNYRFVGKGMPPEVKKKLRDSMIDLNRRKDPFYMVDGISYEEVKKDRVNTHCGVLTESDLAFMESHNE